MKLNKKGRHQVRQR